jgi:AhpD family alkylhydroperoxidase
MILLEREQIHPLNPRFIYSQEKTGDAITMQENPMEVFKREAPEVADAFNGLILSLVASKGLDPKTKQLIYIAMKASMGDQMAVKAHVPMAKAAGATKEEVVDAILMTLTVSGIRGVVTCLPEAVQQFE